MTIITSLEHSTERTKQGYSVLKDGIIKCGNCNKNLLSVIKIQENNQQHNIKVDCPYCNDESFWYKIDGKICIQPCDGLSMVDMNTDIKDEIHFTEIKVIKNGK
jgi:DNA-directed RNA polymerase subunit RPC12/RpoP